jgi:hypothetical protein
LEEESKFLLASVMFILSLYKHLWGTRKWRAWYSADHHESGVMHISALKGNKNWILGMECKRPPHTK